MVKRNYKLKDGGGFLNHAETRVAFILSLPCFQHLFRKSRKEIQIVHAMVCIMRDATYDAIIAILKADMTVSERELTRVSKSILGSQGQDSEDRVLSRNEVAHILGGKSLRFVDYLASEGKIRRVKIPGRKRGIGYSAKSVHALMGSNV